MTPCPARCPHRVHAPCHLEAGHTGPHVLRTTHVPGTPPRPYCTWEDPR